MTETSLCPEIPGVSQNVSQHPPAWCQTSELVLATGGFVPDSQNVLSLAADRHVDRFVDGLVDRP